MVIRAALLDGQIVMCSDAGGAARKGVVRQDDRRVLGGHGPCLACRTWPKASSGWRARLQRALRPNLPFNMISRYGHGLIGSLSTI